MQAPNQTNNILIRQTFLQTHQIKGWYYGCKNLSAFFILSSKNDPLYRVPKSMWKYPNFSHAELVPTMIPWSINKDEDTKMSQLSSAHTDLVPKMITYTEFQNVSIFLYRVSSKNDPLYRVPKCFNFSYTELSPKMIFRSINKDRHVKTSQLFL